VKEPLDFSRQKSIFTRTRVDKLIDFVTGEGPGTKYALICSQCYGHNGLVMPEELDTKQFICLYCQHWNKARRSITIHETLNKLDTESRDDNASLKPSDLANT
jgi:hypothetical protein